MAANLSRLPTLRGLPHPRPGVLENVAADGTHFSVTVTEVAGRCTVDPADRGLQGGEPPARDAGRRPIAEVDQVAQHASAAGGVAVALVIVVAGLLELGRVVTGAHEARAAAVAIANVACLGLLGSAVLLAVRWRLVGEAGAAFYAGVSLLSSVVTLPMIVPIDRGGSAWLVAVANALGPFAAVALLVFVGGAGGADLRSHLRPVRATVLALLGAVALSLAAGLSPLHGLLGAAPVPGVAAGSVVTAACGVAAAGWTATRVRAPRRLLGLAVSGELFAVGLSAVSHALAADVLGREATVAVPAMVLLAGTLPLALAATVELGHAIEAVVVDTARGRQRSELVESQLEAMRRLEKGRNHDLNATLGAVSAALLLLQGPHAIDDPDEARRVAVAAQEQILWLQSQLVAEAGPPRWFQAGDVIERTVAIRRGQVQRIVTSIEPGLVAWGRPDHFALTLNNLLANAAAYAPDSPVAVQAHRVLVGDKAGVQVLVTDHGPGVRDPAKALTPGWRGTTIRRTTGSGLGLSQCKAMVEADMGRFALHPTDPALPLGQQGLTVEVVLRGLDDAGDVETAPTGGGSGAPTGGPNNAPTGGPNGAPTGGPNYAPPPGVGARSAWGVDAAGPTDRADGPVQPSRRRSL